MEARALGPNLTIAAKKGGYKRPLHREFLGEVLLHENADESRRVAPRDSPTGASI